MVFVFIKSLAEHVARAKAWGRKPPLSIASNSAHGCRHNAGLDQTRCATVVITLAAARIISLTTCGSSTAPAASASLAWRISSSYICATMAREAWSPSGSPWSPVFKWLCRCAPTCFSVSTTKPRLMGSPSRPAIRPRPNAPAYHRGLSSDLRDPSSCRRCSVHARWSVSSIQAWVKWARSAGLVVAKACAV